MVLRQICLWVLSRDLGKALPWKVLLVAEYISLNMTRNFRFPHEKREIFPMTF